MKNVAVVEQLGGDSSELWCPSMQSRAPPSHVVGNKVVLLYFSAHWCGPCRRFTPVLKELYKKLKRRQMDDHSQSIPDFEVVFCSMDRMESEYRSYTSDMPWWCLPHKSPLGPALSTTYGVQGIPHLVVVDEDGSVLVADGFANVTADPEGLEFPWRPKPLVELLPSHYIRRCHPSSTSRPPPIATTTTTTSTSGTLDVQQQQQQQQYEICNMDGLDSKYLMLYFSAQWSPPCRTFTPKLSKAYQTLQRNRNDFELLFVSSDRSEESFDEYFGREMSFGALPYAAERRARESISTRLRVRSIPALMIFGPRPDGGGDRPLINDSVRPIIELGEEYYLSDFPYHPKPYGDLNKTVESINTLRCIIVLHEGADDEEQDNVQETLQMAATRYQKSLQTATVSASEEEGTQLNDATAAATGTSSAFTKPLRFYWALTQTVLSKAVRETLHLGAVSDQPVMVLLDVSNQGSYFISNSTEITVDTVLEFARNPGERRSVR